MAAAAVAIAAPILIETLMKEIGGAWNPADKATCRIVNGTNDKWIFRSFNQNDAVQGVEYQSVEIAAHKTALLTAGANGTGFFYAHVLKSANVLAPGWQTHGKGVQVQGGKVYLYKGAANFEEQK